MSQFQTTLDTSQYHSQSSNEGVSHVSTLRRHSGSGAGGILQFSDFFGGPVGQGLGLAGPTPPAGGQ